MVANRKIKVLITPPPRLVSAQLARVNYQSDRYVWVREYTTGQQLPFAHGINCRPQQSAHVSPVSIAHVVLDMQLTQVKTSATSLYFEFHCSLG